VANRLLLEFANLFANSGDESLLLGRGCNFGEVHHLKLHDSYHFNRATRSIPANHKLCRKRCRYVAAIQHTVEAAQVNKPARQTASRAHWKMLRREDLRNHGYGAESIRQGLRDRRTIPFLAKRNTEHSPVSFSLLPTMTRRLGMF